MSQSMPGYKLHGLNPYLELLNSRCFFLGHCFIISALRFHLEKETFILSESSNVKQNI